MQNHASTLWRKKIGRQGGKAFERYLGYLSDYRTKFSDRQLCRWRRLQYLVARKNHVYFRKASLRAGISPSVEDKGRIYLSFASLSVTIQQVAGVFAGTCVCL
jgi:hypothetical protein